MHSPRLWHRWLPPFRGLPGEGGCWAHCHQPGSFVATTKEPGCCVRVAWAAPAQHAASGPLMAWGRRHTGPVARCPAGAVGVHLPMTLPGPGRCCRSMAGDPHWLPPPLPGAAEESHAPVAGGGPTADMGMGMAMRGGRTTRGLRRTSPWRTPPSATHTCGSPRRSAPQSSGPAPTALTVTRRHSRLPAWT